MESKVDCKPFLKWVGGKRKIVPTIQKLIPITYDIYHEPFLGGGSLFFATQPKKAVLSDVNLELINCYKIVRDRPLELIDCLTIFADEYKKIGSAFYYNIRATDRNWDYDSVSDLLNATRFIFLNKTCFNGLYRVNKKGQFNVPEGRYKNPTICDRSNLLKCSQALQGVELIHQDYSKAIDYAVNNSDRPFLYLDPPYVPTSITADFTSYSVNGFNESDQLNLIADLCFLNKNTNAKWIASNSDTKWVRSRYHEFNIKEVYRSGSINCNGDKRDRVKELLIHN